MNVLKVSLPFFIVVAALVLAADGADASGVLRGRRRGGERQQRGRENRRHA